MRNYYVSSNLINLKVGISAAALELMEQESGRSRYAETGGVVAGFGSAENGEIHISHASLPGPRARATRYSFQHEREFCQKFLDELAAQSNGKIDYLGEWHKHFERDPRPSGRDVKTMVSISENSDYHVSQPLLLIIGINNRSSSLRVFVANKTGNLTLIEWEKYVGNS